MRDSSGILLLLAGTLAAGFAGMAMYVVGIAQRQAVIDRTGSGPEPLGARVVRVLDGALRRTKSGQRLGIALASAGIGLPPLTFVGGCLLAAFSAFVLTSFVFPPTLAVVVALSVLGACRAWVGHRRGQRRMEFIAQLPEVARLLSNGAQAGLSLAGAVERATRELDDPAAEELGQVVAELRLGRSLDDALSLLRDRLPSREVAVLMSTLIIQQRSGGDTVRALQDMSDTLESRKDTLREVRTLMAGAVFTSYLVAGMGVSTIFIMNGISDGVLDKMLTSPIGLAALALASMLYAVGFVLIRHTTRIEL